MGTSPLFHFVESLVASAAELSFVRSSGPGGQNVNKVSTAVALTLPVTALEALGPDSLARIRQKLANRISKEDNLIVQVQDSRSQWHNRQLAIARATQLILNALKTDAPRTPTRPTRASKERRLTTKSRTSTIKQGRRTPPAD